MSDSGQALNASSSEARAGHSPNTSLNSELQSCRPNPTIEARASKWHLLARLGPGIIAGASDDDPSGIATYSQAGAQFGLGALWLALFSYPLLCAIQEISARIGRVTGRGVTASMLRNYPRPLVVFVVLLFLISSIFNLGADLGAMGDAMHMLAGGPRWLHILWMAVASLLLQVYVRYTRYVKYLKWLSFSLFAYVITVFLVRVPWEQVLWQSLLPPLHNLHANGYITVVVAVLGTTISPYVFFWQASQEAEEVKDKKEEHPLARAPHEAPRQLSRIKLDTYLGMAASNLVAFFIMLTAAVTLHVHGKTNVETATQAAQALEPLAGRYAYILFSAGIVGTGLLAVPVLAGAAAYAVGEAMRWRVGLQAKPHRAAKFYLTLGAAVAVGLCLNFIHLGPIRALFVAAVINGILAAPIMAMMMLLTQSKKVMGEFTLPAYLRIGGWAGTIAMCIVSIIFFVTAL
jgi:NRAMP (natural resistance-associated macrophage protein)-like metal ion transporter